MKKTLRKPHRFKKKKSIFRNRFFWLGILTLVIVGVVFHFSFFSGIFQIERIIILRYTQDNPEPVEWVVTGEEKVSKENIRLLVEEKLENKILFFKTKSIFLTNLSEIKEDILNNFPRVAEVEISRGFPNALDIVVVERLSLAIWCREDICFLLDTEGVIFGETEPEMDLVKIIDKQNTSPFILGKKVIEKELLFQILEIKSKLRESLKILITEAFIISSEGINAKTSEGWEIYFNIKEDLDWQITKLSLILEKEIPPEKRGNLEYIDLRFSRVYYKYR